MSGLATGTLHAVVLATLAFSSCHAAAKGKTMKTSDLAGVVDVAFGRDRFVTSHAAGQAGVAVWDHADQAHTDPAAWLPRTDLRPGRLALSPDGARVAVAGAAGEPLLVIEVRSGAVKAQLRAPSAGVTALAWSPDGAWLAAAGVDAAPPPAGATAHPDKAVALVSSGRVLVYELAKPAAPRWTLEAPNQDIVAVAFAKGGTLTGLSRAGALIGWSLASGQAGRSVELGDRGHALAISPDGRQLAAALTAEDGASRIELRDATSLAAIATLSGGPNLPVHLAYASDGARLAVTGFDAVQVWDIKTQKLSAKLDHGSDVGSGPRGAAFVPGGLLVVGGDPVLWRVWDLATRKPRVVVAPPAHVVN
jgi:WD40 repeat protein